MMNWLKKLDERLFSPPHTFGTVLSLVAVRLGLFSDSGSEGVEAHRDQPQTGAEPESPDRRQT